VWFLCLILTSRNCLFKQRVSKYSWCHRFALTPRLRGFFFWLLLIAVGSPVLLEQSVKVKRFAGKLGALSAVPCRQEYRTQRRCRARRVWGRWFRRATSSSVGPAPEVESAGVRRWVSVYLGNGDEAFRVVTVCQPNILSQVTRLKSCFLSGRLQGAVGNLRFDEYWLLLSGIAGVHF